ncbi:MFS transporter [Paenibacillus physcomitrellae]|uniref:Glucose/mannose:H+ symporter GlcP n=1 Tax=Paenibacillus physcomitrellae TaxID=1619311 RepID=A0ABQ1GQK5_9BACL|nr:MFS transporter [Paenibacillus physcomitrellae]GGA48053.1 putative glucose/mannose:H+ symporter GlcP [Paenibacillus physcomitrellae]
MKRLIWISGLSYLLIGLAHVIIGSIMPVLLEHYGQDYSAGGTLIFAQFAGFLVGVLGSPWLISRLGKRSGLLIALGVLGAAELLYTLLPSWSLMYVIGSFAGFGFGMIEAVIGTLIIAAAREKAAIAMSRIEVAFGVGALLMPLLSGWLIRSGAWRYGFLLISIFAAVMLIVWLRVRFGELDGVLKDRPGSKAAKQKANGEGEMKSANPAAQLNPVDLPDLGSEDFKTRGQKGWARHYTGSRAVLLAVFVLFFFIYVGIEMGFVNFLPSMLVERSGAGEATAAYGVAVFWLAMSIGRVYAGILAQKIGFAPYIICGIFLSLVFLSLFNLVDHFAMFLLAVLFIGLFLSGIFSIALVYATTLLPGSEATTPSLLIASGGVGGAVLPLLLGRSMDHYGAAPTGWLLAGVLALLLVLGLIIAAAERVRRLKQSVTASL